jgi:phage baseplate assembly protein W
MADMNRKTGGVITEIDELRQSIEDILTTPIGSRRLENIEYGSRLFDLIDTPVTNRAQILIAVSEAIDRWEPRISLSKVEISDIKPGRLKISITGVYKPKNRPVTFEVMPWE